MRKTLLLFCFLLSAFWNGAAAQKYSRVKIHADSKGLAELAAAGVCIDHGDVKRNTYYTSDFSAKEIGIIKQMGYQHEILIDDVKQFYKDQNDPKSEKYVPVPVPLSHGCNGAAVYPTPSNFSLGSMGGYFTYAEIMNKLDSMAILFPSLVKAKAPISATNTFEGRPIYWMKISDNPSVDENEPEMLYSAVHHAREPASVSQLIMYMYYLLENYNSNAEVKYLVDNLEMYFVPLVNPDGYIYNETTDPNGGGMWRKNRRDNLDGEWGIDLNRNYGHNWGFDNNGSSPNTSSDTYRGASAFSEAETQNMRDLCNAHQFKLTLNYHTHGNLLIYPWGYQNSLYTPDSAYFVEYAKHLTHENHYNYGTADQTVAYVTNGSSDDWMYGEQTSKPKIFAMTPEAGDAANGFWPPQNLIVSICKENITQNLHAAHLLLKYAQLKDDEPRYVFSSTGHLNYTIRNIGMGNPASFTVSISSLSPYITSAGAPKSYSSLASLLEVKDSISVTIDPTTPQGQVLQYMLTISNGSYVRKDTIEKVYGQPVTVFSSDGNSMAGWTSTTGWGVDNNVFFSSTGSIADSPNADYLSDDNTRIRTVNAVDLTGAISATLSYRTRSIIEPRYDYAQVLASSDNGVNYTALCGKYTKTGNSFQAGGEPVYDGYQFAWVKEEVNLDAYIGKNILIRFMMRADSYNEADGFYFDDLKVEKIAGSSSVNELKGGLSFSVFPNPTSGEFKIQGSGFKIDDVSVTDLLGNRVQITDCNSSCAVLDLSRNPKGVYFVKVRDEKGNFGVKKVIVQ